jgi:RNA polymerase sigma-70 factor (ECF subfamily)
MVSVLTKIFGTENLETAEDVVQQTFIDALNIWKMKGIPDNPSGWLFRVAKNKTIDMIRRNKHSTQYDFSRQENILLHSEYTLATTIESFWNEELVNDNMLQMMFACCNQGISEENQITLILKTLCGFSTAAIAKTLLTTEENITKRLYRTKEFFRANRIKPEIPDKNELGKRTRVVLNAIYLLFNEGYNSTHDDVLIRYDLMEEAMLLCRLLTENENTQVPETFALMALICFHSARSESRLSTEGDIILLPLQDRKKWNSQLIHSGIEYLNKAAFGNNISTYHLEAAIAYEHCTTTHFLKTNWSRILQLYEWLCRIAPTPITEMNKVVAVLHVHGATEAFENLQMIRNQKKLESFYLYHSLLGEIYSRLQDAAAAKSCFERAIILTRSETEKKMIREKIKGISENH